MTPAVRFGLVLHWIRLLLFSWRSRTNWFVQNASISWIENVLLTPIMRRSHRTFDRSEDEFESPERSTDQTTFGLDYDRSGGRFVNPNAPTTSRAAAAAAAAAATPGNKRHFAVKSTSHGPYGRNAPERETRSRSRAQYEKSPATSRSRKQSKPKRRKDPALLLFREMKRLQNTTGFLIPKLPFGRLVREIMLNTGRGEVTCVTRMALEAIQEATEMYITQCLNDAYLLTQHRNRVTLSVQDFQILRVLKLID